MAAAYRTVTRCVRYGRGAVRWHVVHNWRRRRRAPCGQRCRGGGKKTEGWWVFGAKCSGGLRSARSRKRADGPDGGGRRRACTQRAAPVTTPAGHAHVPGVRLRRESCVCNGGCRMSAMLHMCCESDAVGGRGRGPRAHFVVSPKSPKNTMTPPNRWAFYMAATCSLSTQHRVVVHLFVDLST